MLTAQSDSLITVWYCQLYYSPAYLLYQQLCLSYRYETRRIFRLGYLFEHHERALVII